LAAEKPQKTILVIYSDRNNLAGNTIVDEALRSVLTARSDLPIDFRSEYINNATPLSERSLSALRDFLRNKYEREKFDVIVAVGNDALLFVGGYSDELFEGVPIVSWGSRDLIDNWGTGPAVTGVVEPELSSHLQGGLDFIRTLQPNLRQVFVVSGSSPFDRQRESTARRTLRPYEASITLTYLAGLSLETVQQRLSNLPM